MTKHTPGPWAVSIVDALEIHAKKICVGEVFNAVPWPERMANAHLIAAAPDLLEALKRLTTVGEGTPSFDLAHRDALVAISKAEADT